MTFVVSRSVCANSLFLSCVWLAIPVACVSVLATVLPDIYTVGHNYGTPLHFYCIAFQQLKLIKFGINVW